MPAVKIFAFLDLEQNGTFFKGLTLLTSNLIMLRFSAIFQERVRQKSADG
jgi:hypothetical protein